MRRVQVTSLLLALALLLTIAAGNVQAQEKTLYWESYDVDITIQTNGNIHVIETQHLVFTSGTFRYGVRRIPLTNIDAITDVAVREAGGEVYRYSERDEPFTYRTFVSGNDFNIRYNFPPTADSDRIIVIEYSVTGALLYYPGGDQLVWKGVPADPNIPIQHASITIHLPPGATLDNYDATGPRGTATVLEDGRSVRFSTTQPMVGGPDFAARVQWPSGIVAGQPSDWQVAMDRQDAVRPVLNLASLGLSILLLIAGPLGLYLLWYQKGRDAPVKLPAEWIPEPPSDLPAGMVGTLVDEKAEMKDIIASLIDLARRGVLSIQEVKTEGFLGIGEKRDFIYRLEDDSLPMRPYEKQLIDKLFGKEKEKKLSDLKEKFHRHISGLQKALYEATVQEGYFPSNPERVRTAYGGLGVGALVLTFIVGCVVLVTLGSLSELALCIPLSLGISALGLVLLARYMPRKTQKGAEEAAKWLAFKRYMQDIEKYTKVEEAKEIFDRYLPYAIAFGLEDGWIRKFARVDTAPPPWYYPGPYLGPRPRRYIWWGSDPTLGGRPPGHMSPAPEGGSFSPPTLSDASRGMGASLAGMSAGLGAMLSSTANTLTSRPASQSGSGSWSSGGGWSGGGGFSGGGGGGSSFG